MRTYGKVLDVTDASLRIERKVKGTADKRQEIAENLFFDSDTPVEISVF